MIMLSKKQDNSDISVALAAGIQFKQLKSNSAVIPGKYACG